MIPPWLAFEDLPCGSLGWRMGGGEDYMDTFLEWLYQLSESEVEQYFQENPPPEEWRTFCESHRSDMKSGEMSDES